MADSSSDDEHFDPNWVFYRDRPEWKDVTPVPQDDGPNPVVVIAYSEKFKDIYDYFRAILKSGEKSERAFQLTCNAVDQNPANYTAWHYRRVLLKDLKMDLQEELRRCSEIIEQHPKNYQVWHHRSILIGWLQDPANELQFTEQILRQDAKNYHAWQHRQWILNEFNLWDKELAYVDHLLEQDVRNNSAWNQRYFVISNSSGYTDEITKSEVRYTIDQIKKAPHNESSWNYLKGILFLNDSNQMDYPDVWNFSKKLYDSGCRAPFLMSFMIDCIDEKLEQKGITGSENLLKDAVDFCNLLAEEHDTIRSEYWKYIARKLTNKFGEITS